MILPKTTSHFPFSVLLEEHSSMQEPHPLGNPLHPPSNGGKKQDPIVPAVRTSQEFSKQVT